ncbi:unnamed protein product [Menidia menidia]|uniref:(Atlantic silverside) hypothetical protein n=1 Tax=Menidia menidia TaxID=238744 RepID=A0A8S4BAM2_9TELE|nr:unnamed protein product [Menidia menidia]
MLARDYPGSDSSNPVRQLPAGKSLTFLVSRDVSVVGHARGAEPRSRSLRTRTMSTLVTKIEPKWMRLTFRQPWASVMASSQVRMCTLPPEPPKPPEPPEPVIASKKPFKVDVVGGKRYSWCSCGHSRKQPFCDGAHRSQAPGLSPLRFVPERDATLWLCGCKRTRTPPHCDGSHKLDLVVSAALHRPAEDA